jgi:hypothetical protein
MTESGLSKQRCAVIVLDRGWADIRQMVEEQLKLHAYQLILEKEADGRKQFFGLSVNETITQCLTGGWPKKADKVKSDFKVPDKRCASLTCLDPY